MGRRRRQWAVLAWLAFLFCPPALWAKPVPWEITADTLIHYDNPKSIFAEGNVVLVRPKEAGPPLTITADWIRYDVDLGLVKARGHVFLDSPGEEVRADSAKLDLNSQIGTLENAIIFMEDDHLYLQGKDVEKTGDLTYTLHGSRISACRPTEGSKQPWAIESKKAEVTLEGLTHLVHPRLHVKDVPVAYSPYMVVPTKTKRATGFLFPEWSHSSRDGFGLVTPFFINLSPSSDITLYPDYRTRRGLMAGAELRYVANPFSHGIFMVSYLKDALDDTDADDYKNDGLLRDVQHRYWIRGKADHDFGDNLVGHLDLDLVSDGDFLQDIGDGAFGAAENHAVFMQAFRRGIGEKTGTSRDSTAQLIKTWPNMVLSGELRTVQDAQNDLVLSGNDGDGILEPGETTNLSKIISPLQTLPRFNFTGRTPLAGRRSSLAWASEYVNYWRERGVGAQRLDLHPQFITPLPRTGWVEGKVTTGLRETAYQVQTNKNADWAYDTFQERTAFDFTGNMATILMREFDLSLGDVQWLEHVIRPNLTYTYASHTEERELPSLDGIDRLTAANWLTYSWNNYFDIGGDDGGDNFWNRQLGQFSLSQSYNIRELRRPLEGPNDKRREFSDVLFDLSAYPLTALNIRSQANWNVYGQGLTRYQLTGSYTAPWAATVSLDYRYVRHSGQQEPYFHTTAGDSQHDLATTFSAQLTDALLVRGALNKSFSTSHTVSSFLGIAYKPECWMLEMEMQQNSSNERSIMIVVTLEGLGPLLSIEKEKKNTE